MPRHSPCKQHRSSEMAAGSSSSSLRDRPASSCVSMVSISSWPADNESLQPVSPEWAQPASSITLKPSGVKSGGGIRANIVQSLHLAAQTPIERCVTATAEVWKWKRGAIIQSAPWIIQCWFPLPRCCIRPVIQRLKRTAAGIFRRLTTSTGSSFPHLSYDVAVASFSVSLYRRQECEPYYLRRGPGYRPPSSSLPLRFMDSAWI